MFPWRQCSTYWLLFRIMTVVSVFIITNVVIVYFRSSWVDETIVLWDRNICMYCRTRNFDERKHGQQIIWKLILEAFQYDDKALQNTIRFCVAITDGIKQLPKTSSQYFHKFFYLLFKYKHWRSRSGVFLPTSAAHQPKETLNFFDDRVIGQLRFLW